MDGLTQDEEAALAKAAEAAIAYRRAVPDMAVPPAQGLDTIVPRFRTPLDGRRGRASGPGRYRRSLMIH